MGKNILRTEKGVTLIELLIVVAIIVIIAGVAVPAVFSALIKSKITRTYADLKVIATDLDTYYLASNGYPVALPGKLAQRKDVWGKTFEYDPFDGSMFCVCSGGRDGEIDGNCADILQMSPDAIWNFGCDLCRLKDPKRETFWGNCAVVAPH